MRPINLEAKSDRELLLLVASRVNEIAAHCPECGVARSSWPKIGAAGGVVSLIAGIVYGAGTIIGWW